MLPGSRLVGPPAGGRAASDGDGGVELVVQLDDVAPEQLNQELVLRGVRVRELVVERPTLEQVFLSLTGDTSEHPPERPSGHPSACDVPEEAPPLPPPPGATPGAGAGTARSEARDAAG